MLLLLDRNCPTYYMLIRTITSRDMSARKDNTSKHTKIQRLLLSRLSVMHWENSNFLTEIVTKWFYHLLILRDSLARSIRTILQTNTHTEAFIIALGNGRGRTITFGQKWPLQECRSSRSRALGPVGPVGPVGVRPRAEGSVSGNRDKEHISSTKLSFSHL